MTIPLLNNPGVRSPTLEVGASLIRVLGMWPRGAAVSPDTLRALFATTAHPRARILPTGTA